MNKSMPNLVKIILVLLLFISFPLNAQSPPTANNATNITQTSFTANWTPTTAVPRFYLLIATDAAYTNIVPGYNNLNVGIVTAYNVTGGLTANTLYYYKIGVDAIVAPIVYSNSIAFRTGPLTPVALPATYITGTSAVMNWYTVENAVSYEVTISSNSSFTMGVSVHSIGGLSFTKSDLLPGTEYWYRVCAYNSYGGVSGYSNVISFTTIPDPPPAPIAAEATDVTQTGFTANWLNADRADGYNLDVSDNNSFTNILSSYNNLIVGNVTTYTVSGLTPGRNYYYRLRAYNTGGTSGNSNTVAVTTLPASPEVPLALPAISITQTGFYARWALASGALGYYIDVSPDQNFSQFLSGYYNLEVGNNSAWGISGLTANTQYFYRIRAFNMGGTSGNSNVISVTTLPNVPAVPTAIAATIIDNSSFSANWNAAGGATGYYLDVSTDIGFGSFIFGFNNRNVGNVTTFAVTGVNYNTNYYYRIRAYNTGGPSSNSNVINVYILVGIENTNLPYNYSLYQNYPNPFNPSTIIKFTLKKSSMVKIILYDISGREIEELTNQEYQPGASSIQFKASNLSNGIYFYRIITNEFSDIKKMILIK